MRPFADSTLAACCCMVLCIGECLLLSRNISDCCTVHCLLQWLCLLLQCCVVVGGMSVDKQTRLLRRCPDIVIATPGRLWQLIQQVNIVIATPGGLWQLIQQVNIVTATPGGLWQLIQQVNIVTGTPGRLWQLIQKVNIVTATPG